MQHYTRNTVEASAWCRVCNRATMHRVDGVKLGPCLEPHAHKLSREQEKRAERDARRAANGSLFPEGSSNGHRV